MAIQAEEDGEGERKIIFKGKGFLFVIFFHCFIFSLRWW